ncbi:hypothetical protein AGLY_009773 [Aphis glycines]|uniref:Uncharacterized protein n=1 Tax=Aphis glycines TaxID=307491 RepID=A0A6G0TJ03_APHGL|nr:hypothetical protein AGLY_009773 [Aphis glycines]
MTRPQLGRVLVTLFSTEFVPECGQCSQTDRPKSLKRSTVWQPLVHIHVYHILTFYVQRTVVGRLSLPQVVVGVQRPVVRKRQSAGMIRPVNVDRVRVRHRYADVLDHGHSKWLGHGHRVRPIHVHGIRFFDGHGVRLGHGHRVRSGHLDRIRGGHRVRDVLLDGHRVRLRHRHALGDRRGRVHVRGVVTWSVTVSPKTGPDGAAQAVTAQCAVAGPLVVESTAAAVS